MMWLVIEMENLPSPALCKQGPSPYRKDTGCRCRHQQAPPTVPAWQCSVLLTTIHCQCLVAIEPVVHVEPPE